MAGTLGVTENTDTAALTDLIAGGMVVSIGRIIASGEGDLARGTVLELNATTYEYEVLTAASGGQAAAILSEPIDTTSAAGTAEVYLSGVFRKAGLTWPAGITDANKNAAQAALEARGIILDDDFI